MDQLAQYAQQLADLYGQNAPKLPASLPAAVMTLVFGVAICVLGAKLARWLITVAFAVGGLVAGLSLGGRVDLAPLVTALLGASALGAIGFTLHRLWVGLATGAFLATVAFGVVSTQMVFPHVNEFREQQLVAAQADPSRDQAGAVGEAMNAGWDQFWGMTDSFKQFVAEREPNLQKYGVIAVLFAAALGLLMGIFLCRLTLILFTAAFGTSLIAGGMAMLGHHVEVDMFTLCQQRPDMSALALGAFFVFSIILQTLLTRGGDKAPAAAKD